MKVRCTKRSEEVSLSTLQSLLKLQVLQRKKDITRETDSAKQEHDLEMGSLPLIKRKVACWVSGRTFQMDNSSW